MKNNIHPDDHKIVFLDINTQTNYLIGSSVKTDTLIKLDEGPILPCVHIDLSAASHPFYTGKQRQMCLDGQITKFERRYKKN